MEIFLFLSLLVQAQGQPQNQTDANLPVEVLKFSWSKGSQSAKDADRQLGSANPARREYEFLREMASRGSVEERSRDMRELEEEAAREARKSRPVDLYKYTVEVKNSGTKVIKWVFVDYQTSIHSDPDNVFHRQFACSITIKPNESKTMEGLSSLPPSRVVSANSPDGPLTERLIVNRIEYADGQVWQRSGWQPPEKIPNRGPRRGQCVPL